MPFSAAYYTHISTPFRRNKRIIKGHTIGLCSPLICTRRIKKKPLKDFSLKGFSCMLFPVSAWNTGNGNEVWRPHYSTVYQGWLVHATTNRKPTTGINSHWPVAALQAGRLKRAYCGNLTSSGKKLALPWCSPCHKRTVLDRQPRPTAKKNKDDAQALSCLYPHRLSLFYGFLSVSGQTPTPHPPLPFFGLSHIETTSHGKFLLPEFFLLRHLF